MGILNKFFSTDKVVEEAGKTVRKGGDVAITYFRWVKSPKVLRAIILTIVLGIALFIALGKGNEEMAIRIMDYLMDI